MPVETTFGPQAPPRPATGRSLSARTRSAAPATAAREDPEREIPPLAGLRLAASDFAIRLPRLPRFGDCSLCGQRFAVHGPTGYRSGEPVCDPCLLAHEPHLGMLLALAAVGRTHASRWPETALEELKMQAEWMGFARVYHGFASRLAPVRSLDSYASRVPTDG